MDLNGLSKEFINLHQLQLEKSGVPSHFWNTIFRKLHGQIYDAGEYFQVNRVVLSDEDESLHSWEVAVTRCEGMSASNPNNIFIIDHSWTYQVSEARNHLMTYDGLAQRMAKLMDIPLDLDSCGLEEVIEKVLNTMWKYNNTYSIASSNAEEQLPIWYIMDEFGARIQHSGEPNFRTVPFYYHGNQCCYSLLFIIEDVEEGDEVFRNYVESPPVDDVTRDAQMLPWYPEDLTYLKHKQIEPNTTFFTSSQMNETEPDADITVVPLNPQEPILVFTEYNQIKDHLTDKRFQITDDRDLADIIWLQSHYKDFKSLRTTPHKRINQFPMEHLITVKDLLAVVCRRIESSDDDDHSSKEEQLDYNGPEWLPTTFCLKRELPAFVSYFQSRQKIGLDNHWIIKPWNLARGIDLTVTNNINHILRLPCTGPKIAQKYIQDPVLFWRDDIETKVKFDLRFIVLLLSVKPLKVAVYDRFWIRFGNKAFDLNNLDDYEKHFTVNNYNDNFLLQMFCHEFIKKFEDQNSDYSWHDVQKRIHEMVKGMFVGASMFDPPRGIPNNDQCKGAYGLDIMLDWSTNSKGEKVILPKLLEANFSADCKRACDYYPEFFNDLFSVMFLDEFENHHVTILE